MRQTFVALTACAIIGLGGLRPLAAQSAQAPPVPPVPPATAEATASAPLPGTGQIIQRILVKVNGEIFTQRDLEDLQIDALQAKNRQVTNAQDLQNDVTLRSLLLELTPKLLAGAIDELLIVQRAHELGYKVPESQYKDAIEGIKKDNKIDDAQLAQALQQQGSSMELLRLRIEHEALKGMIEQQEIMTHVAMTEEESRQYYDKHQNEFLSPPAVTLRELLVSSAPTLTGGSGLTFGGTTDSVAKAKIQAALDRVRKGEDFAAVATEVSDAPSKTRGGLMTPVVLDDLSQVVRDATEKLKAGEITEPIKTQRGYQIFKVEARTVQTVLPFDQVRQAIMQKIYTQRREGEVRKYVTRLRAQALIEWKDDSLKKLYESLVTVK